MVGYPQHIFMKPKEILMKGFNADCKEDENIIDIALKHERKKVIGEVEKLKKEIKKLDCWCIDCINKKIDNLLKKLKEVK